MARVKQGSGSGEGEAVTPKPRTRAPRAQASATAEKTDAAPEVLGQVPTPLEDGEFELENGFDSEVEGDEQFDVDPNQQMPVFARPGPQAADASPAPRGGVGDDTPPAAVQGQRFEGRYVAMARLNREDGSVVLPDAEVLLSHEEAMHFLKHKVVRSVGRRAHQRGVVKDLPAGQSFAGAYKTLARLSHEDDKQAVPPGTIVQLDDAQARHYLAHGVVESAAGYAL